MDSVLSLDDGRWLRPAEESCSPAVDMTHEDILQLSNIRQPLPPPVLARVEKEVVPIPPSKVADPRPGPARSSPDGICDSKTYQHLHIVSSNAVLLQFFLYRVPCMLVICKAIYILSEEHDNDFC